MTAYGALRLSVLLVCVVGLWVTSCGKSDLSTTDTAQWLRFAGNFDETPEEITCIEGRDE